MNGGHERWAWMDGHEQRACVRGQRAAGMCSRFFFLITFLVQQVQQVQQNAA